MKTTIAKCLFWIALFLSVLTFASRLGRFHWTVDLLSHFHIQYAVGIALCLVGWFGLSSSGKVLLHPLPGRFLGRTKLSDGAFPEVRSRTLLIPLAALLFNLALVIPFFIAPAGNSAQAAAAISVPASVPLRVMAINISTSNAGYDKVIKLIRQRQPDIVFLSEVRSDLVTRLQEQLADSYPYLHAEPSRMTLGIAFLSHHPFRAIQTVAVGDADRMRRKYLRAELDWQGQPITLIGIHPLPPINASWAASRDSELQLMAEVANQVTQPFILLGDLNASPWSAPMGKLISQSDLRYAAKGFGIGMTWRLAGVLLGAPIDHILVSPQWKVADYVEAGEIGSDHIPIQADLVIDE